jgi:hypothetical protein
MPQRPTRRDRERARRIEALLNRYRSGSLTEQDRCELERLISIDYEEASERADRLIRAKQAHAKFKSTSLSKRLPK